MTLPLAIDMRRQGRRRIVGFMPGKLLTSDRSQEFHCRPLDVSPFGIGLFGEERLDAFGKDFVLILAEHEIDLQLVWTIENPGERSGYRHGLKLKDVSMDMEKICREYGYL